MSNIRYVLTGRIGKILPSIPGLCSRPFRPLLRPRSARTNKRAFVGMMISNVNIRAGKIILLQHLRCFGTRGGRRRASSPEDEVFEKRVIEFVVKSEDEMERFGRYVSKHIFETKIRKRERNVHDFGSICLFGDVGTGKTVFSRGFITEAMESRTTSARSNDAGGNDPRRGSGAEQTTVHVSSPTFLLVNTYDTPLGERILHADLYRLSHEDDFGVLGLPGHGVEERARHDGDDDSSVASSQHRRPQIGLIEWPERMYESENAPEITSNRKIDPCLEMRIEHPRNVRGVNAALNNTTRTITFQFRSASDVDEWAGAIDRAVSDMTCARV